MTNAYETIRQIRRYLTTMELEMLDDETIVERCACEAIKLLGSLAGVKEQQRNVHYNLSLPASSGTAGISSASDNCS